ncbi:MAG: flagellar filament capping protein FliD [Firmicutes bacterium]|nr:flagellar filament capping protein FliD [Bacillota bacterium]
MSVTRVSGLVSGMDTDQIIKDLMRIERLKVDKVYQQKQVLEWQKEQYREIINKVRVFRDTYFDVLKPETNLTSPTALRRMTATTTAPEVVSVTASAASGVGETTFEVLQSATAAKASITGITADSSAGSRLSLNDTMAEISEKLANGSLSFNEAGQFLLAINNEEIIINKTDTLQTVLNKINKTGVQVSYSTFSDTFTITARQTGAGYITTNDGGNFFTALGLQPDAEGNVGEAGRNAEFKINGFAGTNASNTFTIDGLTYTIKQKIDPEDAPAAVTVTTTVDTEGIYKTLESFVNDYNKLIEEINNKLNEEYFRDFPPLTDEQKEAMSEKEIELWEEKAQSGLLRRDSALESMLRNLRQVLYDSVDGMNITQIGIETSSNYRDRGKLVLTNGGQDLKTAIAQNPDQVAELFTRRADIAYSATLTAEERAQRYAQSGLAGRISDVLNDNIRTTRDEAGRKGILLEKAGIKGDITEFQNYYDKQIKEMNKRIDRLNQLFVQKEEAYYRQFAAMEKALRQLYAQGDYLISQLQRNYY